MYSVVGGQNTSVSTRPSKTSVISIKPSTISKQKTLVNSTSKIGCVPSLKEGSVGSSMDRKKSGKDNSSMMFFDNEGNDSWYVVKIILYLWFMYFTVMNLRIFIIRTVGTYSPPGPATKIATTKTQQLREKQLSKTRDVSRGSVGAKLKPSVHVTGTLYIIFLLPEKTTNDTAQQPKIKMTSYEERLLSSSLQSSESVFRKSIICMGKR